MGAMTEQRQYAHDMMLLLAVMVTAGTLGVGIIVLAAVSMIR